MPTARTLCKLIVVETRNPKLERVMDRGDEGAWQPRCGGLVVRAEERIR